jgi:VanZ family protein
MLVIFTASSDVNSTRHSSSLFEPLLRWLFPHLPQPQIETIHLLSRKCCHLTEYAILALLLWRAIRNSPEVNPRKSDGDSSPAPGKIPGGTPVKPAGKDARATTAPLSQAQRRDSLNFRPWRWDEVGLALAIVFLYAASDELHQVFVPGRTGQISDVVVDVAGAGAGLTLLWLGGKALKHW